MPRGSVPRGSRRPACERCKSSKQSCIAAGAPSKRAAAGISEGKTKDNLERLEGYTVFESVDELRKEIADVRQGLESLREDIRVIAGQLARLLVNSDKVMEDVDNIPSKVAVAVQEAPPSM